MEKEILTMEEAADLFGVSVKTFIKLLKEEKVPARKIGREWRFSRSALIDWLSSGDSQAYSASESDTREYFNQVAPRWEEIRKDYYDESIRDYLINLGIFKKNMHIVDLGSGNGYIALAAAKYVKKVIAVDISKEMIKELKKNAKAKGIKNIQTFESDVQDIPLEDETVDMVCASMYLHHIEEPHMAIKEIGRVLKPGGIVFLADYHEHKDMELKQKMHDLWPGFSLSRLEKWFSENNFKNIETKNIETKNIAGDTNLKVGIFVLTAVKE